MNETTKTQIPETEPVETGKKKQKKHRVRKFFCALLALIVLFVGVTTVITLIGLSASSKRAASFRAVDVSAPEFENIGDGVWNIHADNGLKVMQLTDVHIGGGWMSIKKDGMAINAVAAMITAEKPDFVIVTGDVAYPVPFQAGTFNNKSGAKIFAELMENLGVYWTIAFGNHDTESYSYFSRDKIADFYSSGDYPHCLLQKGPADVDGVGNQVFRVVNRDGLITRALILLDSHSYVDGDVFGVFWKYDNIHENQVAWYKSVVEGLQAENAETVKKLGTDKAAAYGQLGKVPTSLFFHIPLTECKDAWYEYYDNGFQDTENVQYLDGYVGEGKKQIYSGIHEDDLFETALELGSTDSVFFGHDHLNNIALKYKGIILSYGMSVDYLAYPGIFKLGSQRGCTILNVDAAGKLTYTKESYYQDKYTTQYPKEQVTMQELKGERVLEDEN